MSRTGWAGLIAGGEAGRLARAVGMADLERRAGDAGDRVQQDEARRG